MLAARQLCRSGNPWHPLSARSVSDVGLRSRDESVSRSESRGDYGVRILPRRIPENDLLDIRPAEDIPEFLRQTDPPRLIGHSAAQKGRHNNERRNGHSRDYHELGVDL